MKDPKPMTHVGTVESSTWPRHENTSRPVQLRETPKFWIDRSGTRWTKLDRSGKPDPRPFGNRPRSGRYGGSLETLLTETIRPLTVAELREPLEKNMAAADNAIEYHKQKRDEAEIHLKAAYEKQRAALRALREFDRVHGLPAEPTEEGGDHA